MGLYVCVCKRISSHTNTARETGWGKCEIFVQCKYPYTPTHSRLLSCLSSCYCCLRSKNTTTSVFGGRKKKKIKIKLMSGTPCSGLRCTALFTRAQSSEARPGKSASTTMTSSALICLFFSVAVIISSSVGAAETDLPHVE